MDPSGQVIFIFCGPMFSWNILHLVLLTNYCIKSLPETVRLLPLESSIRRDSAVLLLEQLVVSEEKNVEIQQTSV